jgi:hypothetical protein
LFKENLLSPYEVKSVVPVEIFREFISALDDGAITITSANVAGLSLLCAEFGFEALATQLSEFRSPAQTTDAEARARIAVLEERELERACDTAALQAEVARLWAAVESLRTAVGGGAAQSRSGAADLSPPRQSPLHRALFLPHRLRPPASLR